MTVQGHLSSPWALRPAPSFSLYSLLKLTVLHETEPTWPRAESGAAFGPSRRVCPPWVTPLYPICRRSAGRTPTEEGSQPWLGEAGHKEGPADDSSLWLLEAVGWPGPQRQGDRDTPGDGDVNSASVKLLSQHCPRVGSVHLKFCFPLGKLGIVATQGQVGGRGRPHLVYTCGRGLCVSTSSLIRSACPTPCSGQQPHSPSASPSQPCGLCSQRAPGPGEVKLRRRPACPGGPAGLRPALCSGVFPVSSAPECPVGDGNNTGSLQRRAWGSSGRRAL